MSIGIPAREQHGPGGAERAGAVLLGGATVDREFLDGLGDRAAALAPDPRADAEAFLPGALDLAVELGLTAPPPGEGYTQLLWEQLATIAAADLSVARVVEPHLDALAILRQAGPMDFSKLEEDAASSWGVFAAEAPDLRLEATLTDTGWRLDGVKPWCSLAAHLSHAVVTAHTGDTRRRAFAVRLRGPGVEVRPGNWAAHGLAGIASGPVTFDGVPAVPVGPDGWYLDRPGFAWGGIGVAAVWYGGAVGVARRLWQKYSTSHPDQIGLLQLGAVDAALASARCALLEAARLVDAGEAAASEGALLAHRVRAVVAAAAEEVLAQVAHALGPAPLAFEAAHARRVADLQLYVRQDHAERDRAALGQALLARGTTPW